VCWDGFREYVLGYILGVCVYGFPEYVCWDGFLCWDGCLDFVRVRWDSGSVCWDGSRVSIDSGILCVGTDSGDMCDVIDSGSVYMYVLGGTPGICVLDSYMDSRSTNIVIDSGSVSRDGFRLYVGDGWDCGSVFGMIRECMCSDGFQECMCLDGFRECACWGFWECGC